LPLELILQDVDFVVVASATSAALDIALSGIPFVIIEDGAFLSLNPFLGHGDYKTIRDALELRDVLIQRESFQENSSRLEFINRDPTLTTWLDLIAKLTKREA
jgi:hypothetical protein